MPAFFTIRNLFILASYLALSAAPFLPLAFGKSVGNPAHILGCELLSWLAIWAIFKRPAFFHWLLIPAFLALPTNIYLNVFYGQGITPHHLGIIAETSPVESVEFLGQKVWLLLAIMLMVVGWWYLTWRMARRTRALDWNHTPSRLVAIAALALGLSVGAYGYTFGIQAPPPSASASEASASSANNASSSSGEDGEEDDDEDDATASTSEPEIANWLNLPKLPSWMQLPVERETFAETWPFGLSMHFYDFWTERQYLSELNNKNNSFTFGAHQAPENNAPQIVVMVIGESSRFDRWELNGYSRNTNPQLKQEANLVSLQDVITPVSATRLSVPVIISRKPGRQSLTSGFSEKSMLTAFKEAGFKTYWISNQISFGQFDTPVSAFAKEADVVQFMNLGGFTDNSNHDQILLDPLQNAMKDPSPKKLIVLHTLGNHWNYSHRYPKEFDKWQPSLFGVDKPEYTNTVIKPQMNNSYDNSILYVDWFLSQVVDRLKTSGQLTSMLYVADHGQVLYDGECNLAFHGHNTQYEFHIPSVVWYSDQYKAAYPAKVAQLLRHKKSKLSTENMFHSLLDMANVQYDGERLDRSFFSSKFRRHKRYVDSHGWTNYDNATMKGDCHKVIDKGTPLAQK